MSERCRACGDPVAEKGDGHCRECRDELINGVIPNVLGPIHQSHASHLTPRQAVKLEKTTGG